MADRAPYTAATSGRPSRQAGARSRLAVQIASHRYADALVAAPVGGIDHVNAPHFEYALAPMLAQAGNGALVLDFSGVDYISSAGLRVLMIAASKMKAQQGRLVVCSLSSVVSEIFAISRFHRVLTVKPTLADALEHVSPAALAAYRSAGEGPAAP
jgi:anti-anti-sigma factor